MVMNSIDITTHPSAVLHKTEKLPVASKVNPKKGPEAEEASCAVVELKPTATPAPAAAKASPANIWDTGAVMALPAPFSRAAKMIIRTSWEKAIIPKQTNESAEPASRTGLRAPSRSESVPA